MEEFNNESIARILQSYKRKREMEKARYERLKDTPEFKLDRNERSRKHYNKNKDKVKERYKENKDLIKAKQLLYYYKSNNKLDIFKVRHHDKLHLINHLLEQ